MNKPEPFWRQLIVPIFLVVIFMIAIWGVLRLQAPSTPPSINVSLPNTLTTDSNNVVITGKTTSGANLTINGSTIKVNDGKFSDKVGLKAGQNTITFIASQDSKTTTITRVVTYSVPVAKAPVPIVTVTVPGSNNLAKTGPDQNIGIIGLTGILISLFIYRKTKKPKADKGPKFKTFTGKAN